MEEQTRGFPRQQTQTRMALCVNVNSHSPCADDYRAAAELTIVFGEEFLVCRLKTYIFWL